jgi:hypothetical protein
MPLNESVPALAGEAPAAARPARSPFLTVFPSIVLPMFLAIVDQTIVSTALPAIGASLGGVTALLAEGEAAESLFAALVVIDIAPRMDPSGVARTRASCVGTARASHRLPKRPRPWRPIGRSVRGPAISTACART